MAAATLLIPGASCSLTTLFAAWTTDPTLVRTAYSPNIGKWLEEVLSDKLMEVLTTTVRLKVPVEAGYATGETWGDLDK